MQKAIMEELIGKDSIKPHGKFCQRSRESKVLSNYRIEINSVSRQEKWDIYDGYYNKNKGIYANI